MNIKQTNKEKVAENEQPNADLSIKTKDKVEAAKSYIESK